VQDPGLVRHVMARGNGKMQIFLDDVDYRHFVHLIGDVVEDLEVECWNYCVMPNHYHATLKPTRPNLSEAMRRINSGYALWWNKRHGRVGHVFQGRPKAQIVEHTEYLLTLARYVVLNPVRAGLVQRPEDWTWSSYRATVGLCPQPSFLLMAPTLCLFGEEDETRRARFAQFVNNAPDDDSLVDRIRSNERVLGTTDFKRKVRNSVEPRTATIEQTHVPGDEGGISMP
jgi:putative transposase